MSSVGDVTTETLTLADFLLARIGEDEEWAQETFTLYIRPGKDGAHAGFDSAPVNPPNMRAILAPDAQGRGIFGYRFSVHPDPARVLAECEAKRRIVARLSRLTWQPDLDFIRRTLALPYADHPDYRQEWKP